MAVAQTLDTTKHGVYRIFLVFKFKFFLVMIGLILYVSR